ncbi:zinc ribbon domain-containing protein [Aeromonas caviae]|uniref:Zinc ribbon domain-containing protein n=1 Tax=Aeromonas caviae TaxID=648 RepID=A0AA43AJR0_AERCA|nr:zinc ribbon domain-containing protein [Aeromonas caviae]MBL0649852.1 zinc ribbon domain-containing protein [Aeromonas caviae]MDH1898475.1 zinc ribbon domain-containing protein [Aeromonas caviae]
MNTLTCLACQGELDSRSRETTCGQCQARYRIRALCPACGQELERLRACGAVDYFCNHCNTLVSKRTVLFEAQPDKA